LLLTGLKGLLGFLGRRLYIVGGPPGLGFFLRSLRGGPLVSLQIGQLLYLVKVRLNAVDR
jgi:hypothetical protein